jgi:hypothetical protein
MVEHLLFQYLEGRVICVKEEEEKKKVIIVVVVVVVVVEEAVEEVEVVEKASYPRCCDEAMRDGRHCCVLKVVFTSCLRFSAHSTKEET